jgi:hypothetical protein
MGYRGLLLNDPYKRDRIDGCMLDIFRSFDLLKNEINRCIGLWEPEKNISSKILKCG